MKKLAIINPGGTSNFGERAIMLGTVFQLRGLYADAEIAIFGYSSICNEDPSLYKELKKFKITFYEPLVRGSNRIYKFIRIIGFFIFPRAFLSDQEFNYLKSASIYSKGQESFTQDYGMLHFIDSFLEQLMAKRINNNLILYGHSVGPIYKFRWTTSKIIKIFKKIYVRDSMSLKTVINLGYDKENVEQINDLAYEAVNNYQVKNRLKEKNFYLLIPNAAICRTTEKTEKYISNINTIVEYLLNNNIKVIVGSSVISQDWNNDYKICEKIKSNFPEVQIKYYKELYDFLDDLQQSQLTISSRLHPLIMTNALGKKLIALSRSNKVLGLLGDLKMESVIIDPFNQVRKAELEKII